MKPEIKKLLDRCDADLAAAAAAMGRKGGSQKTPAQKAAAKANGRNGGRPALTSAVKHARKLMRENYAAGNHYSLNGCPAMAEVCFADAARWKKRAAQLQREGETAL